MYAPRDVGTKIPVQVLAHHPLLLPNPSNKIVILNETLDIY